MKNPANSNIYEANAEGVLAAFGDYVEAAPEDLLMVIAAGALAAPARGALSRSAEQLGFGRAVAWVALDGGDIPLGAKELLAVVEGLDPVALVAADAEAAALLAEAYRCALAPDTHGRLAGRPVAAFASFASMLGSDDLKQQAWALLKHLRDLP